MPKALKTPEQKRAYELRLEAIRSELSEHPVMELNSFCLYTQRDKFPKKHVYNVLRVPVRRYDDEILKALEAMVKATAKLAA
jgi:hypothetical protein